MTCNFQSRFASPVFRPQKQMLAFVFGVVCIAASSVSLVAQADEDQSDAPVAASIATQPAQPTNQPSPLDPLLPPTTGTVRLPTSKVNTLGFTLDIELVKQPLAGSVPVNIVASSTSTFAADRRLTIRFRSDPEGQLPPTNGLVIDVPLLLPQGATTARVTRYLPKFSAGYLYRLGVYEDGRPLEDCVDKIGAFDTDVYRNEQRLNWLLITDSDDVDYTTLPDLRPLMARDARFAASSFRGTIGSPRDDPRFYESMLSDGPDAVAGQSELPTDWRGYQHYDLIILDPAAAEAAIRNGKYEAIQQWVLNGGSIALYDSESEQSFVDTLNLTAERSKSLTLNSLSREHMFNDNIRRPVNEGWNQKIWLRPLGAGIAFGLLKSDESDFPSTHHWWIVEHTLGHRVSPMLRRGVDPILGDRRFSRWLIPGVAQPPVYTFMGLLGLFVILVGPVAYRSTAKRGRTYLMFLIAPVLAIATTALMFTYGILSDGFGTSARVRQLTWVDGVSGNAGERVQSTYFAGLRPTEGLSFAGDAEVMRYTDGSDGAWEELAERSPAILGNIRVEAEQQIFDSAFLPSRQQRQFIVHQPRVNIGNLSIETQKSDPLAPTATITNRFGFPLRHCIIRDADGDYWLADHVPNDSEAIPCETIPLTKSSQLIGDLYNKHRPLDQDIYNSPQRSYRRKTRDLMVSISDQIKHQSMSQTEVLSGSFEGWLNQRMQLEGEIPHNHFVALSDVSRDVILVSGTEVVDSVRYVFGTLK
ncbi:signal peptide protein [Rhodopirellula maiorica SM1]|uniref:Signal peptide protein n=1 Tax=Rhodopirellula maiorica SM1 TaxID=1265738 RepID=M5RKZ1_9BACT|nr:hypothetical protein [Rhodopirellula maiorica]EMI16042.1 signal peptide protein [Rhodopirellula maiorica SM1]